MFAVTGTGVGNSSVCQPDGRLVGEGAGRERLTGRGPQRAGVRADVPGALVEPDAAAPHPCRRTAPWCRAPRRRVTGVGQRRDGEVVPDRARAGRRPRGAGGEGPGDRRPPRCPPRPSRSAVDRVRGARRQRRAGVNVTTLPSADTDRSPATGAAGACHARTARSPGPPPRRRSPTGGRRARPFRRWRPARWR